MECALCILLIFRFVTCDERFTNLQSVSLLEIDNIPETWVPQPKRALFVIWSWTKCLSERSRNSHFCSFLGMEVSDSCSRIVNLFSIPFQFLNIGNKFLSFLSVPDFWEWYDCTLVPLLCSRKLFPSIPDKWGRKRFRPWQDSNLQSPDPKPYPLGHTALSEKGLEKK